MKAGSSSFKCHAVACGSCLCLEHASRLHGCNLDHVVRLVDVAPSLDLTKKPGNHTWPTENRETAIAHARSIDVVLALTDDALCHALVLGTAVEAPIGPIVVADGGSVGATRAAESVGA